MLSFSLSHHEKLYFFGIKRHVVVNDYKPEESTSNYQFLLKCLLVMLKNLWYYLRIPNRKTQYFLRMCSNVNGLQMVGTHNASIKEMVFSVLRFIFKSTTIKLLYTIIIYLTKRLNDYSFFLKLNYSLFPNFVETKERWLPLSNKILAQCLVKVLSSGQISAIDVS